MLTHDRSLGMMMWEMLSGQAPWKGMSAVAIVAAVSDWWRVCHMCLCLHTPCTSQLAAPDSVH
jgi:hypothetical protein